MQNKNHPCLSRSLAIIRTESTPYNLLDVVTTNLTFVQKNYVYNVRRFALQEDEPRNGNVEGLIYADLDLKKKPRKKTPTVVQTEPNTEYAVIDFTKKAPPEESYDNERPHEADGEAIWDHVVPPSEHA